MATKIIFIDGLSNIAAAQTYFYLREITKNKYNYELSFICPINSDIKWPLENQPPNVNRVWAKNNYVRKIFNFIKSKKPSLVHLFFEIRMFGSLAAAIKLPFLLFLIKTTKTKIILTLYSPFITYKQEKWILLEDIPIKIPRFLMKILVKIFIQVICNFSNKIIVETEIIKKGLIEYFGIKNEKINVIKNAVSLDLPKINQTKKEIFLTKFSNKKIILCFGVVSPRKGQNIAIKAFNMIKNELPNHILIIAGKRVPEFKSYEMELKKMINEMNLQNRIFDIGLVDNEETNILFKFADITLWPYLPTIYGSGAFSWALQYKKPSIVTKIYTFQEILADCGALFVEPRNIKQLADAIVKLEKDEKLKIQLKNEMQNIANLRSCENITNEHLKLYREILEN